MYLRTGCVAAPCVGVDTRGRADHGQRGQEDGGKRRAGSYPRLVAGEGLGRDTPVHEHGEYSK